MRVNYDAPGWITAAALARSSVAPVGFLPFLYASRRLGFWWMMTNVAGLGTGALAHFFTSIS